MTEEKMRRTVIAAAVAGTLLLVFLLSVIVGQLIRMAVLDKRIDRANDQIAEYTQVIEKKENDLAYFESELGLETVARGEYGAYKPNETTNHE
ncbi:MAG: hypothetical protein IJY62_03570 [Clostridia bacterium]|nr:hypothetical protein [Clostridia bacterium]